MERSHGIIRGILLAAGLAAASAAHAQLDVQDVTFRRGVDRIQNGLVGESAFAEVVVTGDGINSVLLTFPDDSSLPLAALTAREFRLLLSLDDEAELDVEFGPGPYELDFNGGALIVALDHVVPAVPSPAIASPLQDSQNNSPTTTPFSFNACPGAICGVSTDHVFTRIDDVALPFASAFLPAGSTSYSPPQLTEDADWSFLVDNVAHRVGFELADVGDPFIFVQSFIQSDSVDFSTGFRGLDEAPLGDFSVAVAAPENHLLDPSGSVDETLAGVRVVYDFDVAPSGKVTGAGNADVDANGSLETPVSVKGKLKGKEGSLGLKVTAQIKNKLPGSEASAKYTREQEIAAATGDFTGSQLLKGNVLGIKVEEAGALGGSVATPADWQLDFSISTEDGRKLAVSGLLTTGDGSMIALAGSGTYKGTTTLGLKSSGADKGVSFKLKDFSVDAMGNISGGTLAYKAFGQSGSLSLP